jgi:hypothetical protein
LCAAGGGIPATGEPASRSQGFGNTESSSLASSVVVERRRDDALEEHQENISSLSPTQLREELVDLLGRMTGQAEEYRRVEVLVNALEEVYQPAQTLQFFNFAAQGVWQLLFSTNLAGTPNPAKFRLRELTQHKRPAGLSGQVTNTAVWDFAQEQPGIFDVTGTFSVECSYNVTQGSRMELQLDDHRLELSKGSKVPQDVQKLVSLLHRSMPKELFDPTELFADTTYLDADVKIVRYTGRRMEGVRDIFLRVRPAGGKEQDQ